MGAKRGGGDSNFKILKKLENEQLPKLLEYMRRLDQQQIEILTRLENSSARK